MKRFVVMEDVVMASPCYVAKDEQDAARFLSTLAKEKEDSGRVVRRINSLTMIVDPTGKHTKYQTIECESWE